MLSLKDRIKLLEHDLTATPPLISVYSDLPFAILRYEPREEPDLRREVALLAVRLERAGLSAHIISLAELLWESIEKSEGLDALVDLERTSGFPKAQAQVTGYLSDPDFCPLTDLLAERLGRLDHRKDVALLVRVAAMAPAIYQMSALLEGMKGRTTVPSVLFYPGSLEGIFGLKFMDLAGQEPIGNYRVKIYG
ncbi:MAG: DUF1788 domain-containing protein [Peptococcaceae bacterium]|jgi:hypothetical protein|nr:DUF1788 domain-containing protein [Peptococcaceae bacterium]